MDRIHAVVTWCQTWVWTWQKPTDGQMGFLRWWLAEFTGTTSTETTPCGTGIRFTTRDGRAVSELLEKYRRENPGDLCDRRRGDLPVLVWSGGFSCNPGELNYEPVIEYHVWVRSRAVADRLVTFAGSLTRTDYEVLVGC